MGVRAGVALGQRTLGLDCSPMCMPATLTFLSLSFLTHREQGTACFPKLPDVLGTEGQVHVAGIQQSKHGRWGWGEVAAVSSLVSHSKQSKGVERDSHGRAQVQPKDSK